MVLYKNEFRSGILSNTLRALETWPEFAYAAAMIECRWAERKPEAVMTAWSCLTFVRDFVAA